MLSRSALLLVLASQFGWVAAGQISDRDEVTVSVSGSVLAADSKGGLRSIVTWTRQSSAQLSKLPYTGAVATNEKGEFTVPNLAIGIYVFCVQSLDSLHIDPCLWDPVIPRFEFRADQRPAPVAITVRPAVSLEMEISDSEQRIATPGRSSGVRLLAYVPLPDGRRVVLPLTRTRDGVHVLSGLVPANQDVPIVVEAPGLRFTDFEGRPWNVNRAAYVVGKIAATERQHKVGVQVSGN